MISSEGHKLVTVNNHHRYAAWFLFTGISAAYLLMAVKFPHAYIVATYEDLVGEWAQVFFFAITMLLAARQAFISPRFRLFFSVLALACLYVAGEEISWGQRLFDLPTPEFFSEHNLQQETNLHNFFTGPIKTTMKQGLEYAVAGGLIGYGFIYPWMLRLRLQVALWLEKKGLAAPPLYLSPFFILSAILELQLFRFNEAEVAEIMIPFALAVMTLGYTLSYREQLDIHDNKHWMKVHSSRLAGQTVLVFICVVCLAIGTTLACYASPRLGPDINDRYFSGIEKFAGRYMRYEQWDVAAGLYLQILQEEPNRASIRRKLYTCYNQMGQGEQAQLHMDLAIKNDLRRLERKPDSITANISLVRNYQLAGDSQNAQLYMQQALEIGLTRKANNPQDPRAAYWLGTCYELLGDYAAAYKEFERAASLRPGSLKYKKAMISTGRLLQE